MAIEDLKYLSRKKKVVFMSAVVNMIIADDKVNDGEGKAMVVTQELLDFEDFDIKSDTILPWDLEDEYAKLSGDEMISLIALLAYVIKSDGDISDDEVEMLISAMKANGMSDEFIQQVLATVL